MRLLQQLWKEHKLALVEPSEDVSRAYTDRSNKSLGSAKALLKMNNLEDAVALAYYSMYYSLLALLFRVGIKCENHTAAIYLLQELFAIDNKIISKAKKERVDKQYYVDFSVTREEVQELIEAAEEFTAQLSQFIAFVTQDKVTEARRKLQNFLKK